MGQGVAAPERVEDVAAEQVLALVREQGVRQADAREPKAPVDRAVVGRAAVPVGVVLAVQKVDRDGDLAAEVLRVARAVKGQIRSVCSVMPWNSTQIRTEN